MRRRFSVVAAALLAIALVCGVGLWIQACTGGLPCGPGLKQGLRTAGVAAGMLLAASGALVAIRATWLAMHARASIAALSRVPVPGKMAPEDGERDAVVIRDRAPVAFCAGMFQPRIYITECLANALRSDELSAVLIHEREHARRRDPLRRVLRAACADVFFYAPVLGWWSRVATRRSELSADAAALQAVGSTALAGALCAVSDLGGRDIAGFGGAQDFRVAKLLGDDVAPVPPTRREVVGTAAGLAFSAALVACIAPLIAAV